MPIYAYKCESCGFAKDVLQKMSDSPLTECPTCGASAFKKQLTAAGFQLKGSGWYATDFKGSTAPSGAAADTSAPAKPTADGAAQTAAPAKADSPAASTTGGCGGGCACH
jgi:putative FmdB family regulatory protein